jgi:7-carboxy-7-deazaguanine synthase
VYLPPPMAAVYVTETFSSIQGESSFAGATCFFIRLGGCNLRCRYCDTPLAREPGRAVEIADLVAQCAANPAAIAEITGGEPLLQPGFRALAEGLRDRGGKRAVLVETNGSQDLSVVPPGVVTIMDAKCPGSGEAASLDERNLARLRPGDEVKFVIGSRADYEWARAFVARHHLATRCAWVLFGPVAGSLAPADLARWIVQDGLPVRLQIQLHRLTNMP